MSSRKKSEENNHKCNRQVELQCVKCATEFSSANQLINHIYVEHNFQPEVSLSRVSTASQEASSSSTSEPKEKKPRRKKSDSKNKGSPKRPTKRQRKEKKTEEQLKVALLDADGYSIPKIKIGRFNNVDAFGSVTNEPNLNNKTLKNIPFRNQLQPIQNSTPRNNHINYSNLNNSSGSVSLSSALNTEDGLSTLMSEVYNVLDGHDTSILTPTSTRFSTLTSLDLSSIVPSTDSSGTISTELTNVMREIKGLYDDDMTYSHFASAFEIPQGVKMTPNHVPSGYPVLNNMLTNPMSMMTTSSSSSSSSNDLSHNLDGILSKSVPDINLKSLCDSNYNMSRSSMDQSPSYMNSLPNHDPSSSAFMMTSCSKLSNNYMPSESYAPMSLQSSSQSVSSSLGVSSSISRPPMNSDLALPSSNMSLSHKSNSSISSTVPGASPQKSLSPHVNNVQSISSNLLSPTSNLHSPISDLHSPISKRPNSIPNILSPISNSTSTSTPPLNINSSGLMSPLRENAIQSPVGNTAPSTKPAASSDTVPINKTVIKKEAGRLNIIPTEKLMDSSAKMNLTNNNANHPLTSINSVSHPLTSINSVSHPLTSSNNVSHPLATAQSYFAMMNGAPSSYGYYGAPPYGGSYMQHGSPYMQSPQSHPSYYGSYPPSSLSSSQPPSLPSHHLPAMLSTQQTPLHQNEDHTFKRPGEPPNKQPKIVPKKLSSLLQTPSEKKQAMMASANRPKPPISSVYSIQRNTQPMSISQPRLIPPQNVMKPTSFPTNGSSKAPPPSIKPTSVAAVNSSKANLPSGVSILPAKPSSVSADTSDTSADSPAASFLKKRGVTISSVAKPATRKLTSSVNITPVMKKTPTIPEKIGQVEIVPKGNFASRPNQEAELVKEADCNLGIPIINLNNKAVLHSLGQMGICNFIPVSQIRGGNHQSLGLPILSTSQSTSKLEDLGACGVLNLGAVYKLK